MHGAFASFGVRSLVTVLAASLAVAGAVIACGQDGGATSAANNGPGSSTNPDNNVDACATPNEGCACDDEGAAAECGHVERRDGNYVTCSMGYRACTSGKWGACKGTVLETKAIPLHTLSLSLTPSACTDPCDPNCKEYKDNAEGGIPDAGAAGLIVTDGGLTIDPGVDGGPSGVTGFATTAGGVTSCTPDNNVVGAATTRACTPPGITQCQQDFHCDPSTNTCLWNGGPGYSDSTCTGVDLTVGAPCGTSGSAPPTVPVCNRGTTTLAPGATITLTESTGASPPNGCTAFAPPTCTYTTTDPLPAGGCMALTYCNNTPGAKFITVNAGVPGSQPVTECSDTPAGQRCQNNSAYMKTDGVSCGLCTTCDTTLSGKVFDPSGDSSQPAAEKPSSGANNVALPGILVEQPATALKTLTDGQPVTDTCDSVSTPYVTATVTDTKGMFTLHGVSPGASGKVPIVVQSGRWRRKINITTADLVNGTNGIISCVDNPVKPGKLRMPRSQNATTDNPATAQSGVASNMPKMALVMGNRESLECGILKYGISPTEMQKRVSSTDTARIQLYSTSPSGMTTSTGMPPSGTNIWNTMATLNEYTALVLPCTVEMKESPTAYASTAQKNNIVSWLDNGGRAFMDHWAGEAFIHKMPPTAYQTISTWNSPLPNSALGIARGKLLTTTPPQAQLQDWMANMSGSTDWGAGWMRSDEPWQHAVNPAAGKTTEWIRGLSSYNYPSGNQWAGTPAGDYSLSFSFETPIGGPTAKGRVIYNGMHVSQARAPSGSYPDSSMTFPSSCQLTAGLSSEERALEFQFFQLTACALGGAPVPPAPPAQPPLPAVTYYRDYVATCNPGDKIQWDFFYWQSINPTATTQIEFRAATADAVTSLPLVPGTAPQSVPIGTATTTVPAAPPPAPQWGSAATTVNTALVTGAATPSKKYLRVFMNFLPDNSTAPKSAPTLTNWRQTYSCIPNE